MERLDGGVRAVPLGLGRVAGDHPPHEDTAERGGDRHQPQPVRADDRERIAALVGKAGRPVAGDLPQEEPVGRTQQQVEDLRRGGPSDAEEQRLEDQPPLNSWRG